MKIEFFNTKPKQYIVKYEFAGYVLSTIVAAEDSASAVQQIYRYEPCDKILSCIDIDSLGK